MIKALVFDFVQTLGDAASGYKDGEKNAQNKLIEALGITDTETFMGHFREIRKKHFLAADFNRKNQWLELQALYGKNLGDAFLDKLADEYWQFVIDAMKLFPEAEEVIIDLKKKYKLGLICNSQRDGSTRALQSPEFDRACKYFDSYILSGTDGIPAKPDPAPFRMMLKNLGVTEDETIYVGDDYRVDIEGAHGAGIKCVWLKHYSVKRNWPENTLGVPEITDLRQLSELDLLK